MHRFAAVCAFVLFLFDSTALAQIETPFGTLEFRWRERALGLLPVSGGAAQLSIAGGTAAVPSSQRDSVADPFNPTDARFALILEARVTRDVGYTQPLGLLGGGFHLASTDARSQGRFAGTLVNTGSSTTTGFRNAAPSTTSVATQAAPLGSGVVLPPGATTLPGTDDQGDRGIFGPFRTVADIGGKNSVSIGRSDLSVGSNSTNPTFPTRATLELIVIHATSSVFEQVDPDTGDPLPYTNRYDFAGQDTWVPVFSCVYNVLDTTVAREVHLEPVMIGRQPNDNALRVFRGILNTNGIDSWRTNTTGIPPIAISIVPAPGVAAVLGAAAIVIARRRR